MSIRSVTRTAFEPADDSEEPSGRVAEALDTLARRERALWAVVAFALVGDLLLTGYGLSIGLVEQNPVAASVLGAHGLVGMAALKLPATALALGWRAVLPSLYRGVVPVALALPWLVALGVNAGLILVVS
ncbi:hypothetical protein [Candidatus Halobonum tyrrellensis]|uniref:hypothetical protein n=1 Tax=Candidatus Halobonum tyrrellensis TaxID=1431545 RepID=UPI00190F8584|nr:hypothetical protein [Candidatus Halobonum tyrrellensis]